MSKVKSKIRKAKGRGEEEEEIGAAGNNLEEKDLLCCLPKGQGTEQSDPKKMYDSVLKLKSVPEVRFYFPACVLDSEFRA